MRVELMRVLGLGVTEDHRVEVLCAGRGWQNPGADRQREKQDGE